MVLQALCRNFIIEDLIKRRQERKDEIAKREFMRNKDEWNVDDQLIYETRFLTRRMTTFKLIDMPFPLQAKTYALARRAMLKYYDEHDMARFIKRNLERYTALGNWQVAVGTNFGSAFTAEEGRFVHFWIGALGFLIFKIGSYNLLKA